LQGCATDGSGNFRPSAICQLLQAVLDMGEERFMSRNVLCLVVGVLAVATLVFGYQLYQERQNSTGIQIDVIEGGISIETN
jgi:hypothetical protein